jgi:uncharacterized protein (DUF2336 family)
MVLAELSWFASIALALELEVARMTMSLAQLQILARERLPGKRHELLRELTGVFFESAPELRPQERVVFDDILEKVLDEVEPLARQELAERLAARADAPRRVVGRRHHRGRGACVDPSPVPYFGTLK